MNYSVYSMISTSLFSLKSRLFSRLLGANMPFLICSLMDFA